MKAKGHQLMNRSDRCNYMAIRNNAAVLPKPPYSGHQVIPSSRATDLDETSQAWYTLSSILATLVTPTHPYKVEPT